jgi:mycothiol synthase
MAVEQKGQWHIREYCEADIPRWVELLNLEYPDEPTTIEQEEHWERSYPKGNPRLRLAIEDSQGQFLAVGACEKPFWAIAPGVYTSYGVVHPSCRGRGIGQSLLDRLQSYAAAQGADKLWTDCRENQTHSMRFLESAGFRPYGIRIEQAVDLEAFDLKQFRGAFDRVTASGYRILTLAELRRERPNADRLLYEVFRETVQDVPLPGGARISMDFEQWHKGLESPATDPNYIFLAMQGDKLVGETALELLKGGPAITDSTGVLRDHRGRGIALAIKLASLQALKERGYKEARTHNDTENPAILRVNEKIGYRRLPGWLQWEKRLR